MKDDMISRTAALKGLEDLNIASFYEENEHSKEAYTEVKTMLKALPSAQPDVPDTNVGYMISRQAAITEFSRCELTPDGGIDANYAIDFLKQMPPVDAVPVVRCKDCKHYQFADNRAFGFPVKRCEWTGFENVDDDDFCSRAERRTDDCKDNV